MALLPLTDTVTPFIDHVENTGSLSHGGLRSHLADLGHISVNVSINPIR